MQQPLTHKTNYYSDLCAISDFQQKRAMIRKFFILLAISIMLGVRKWLQAILQASKWSDARINRSNARKPTAGDAAR